VRAEVKVTRDFGPFYVWEVVIRDSDGHAVDVADSYIERTRKGAVRQARRCAESRLRYALGLRAAQDDAIKFTITPKDLEAGR
jgi:hypothetical protein